MRRMIPAIIIFLCLVYIFVAIFPRWHGQPDITPYRVAVIMRPDSNIFWQRVWDGVRTQAAALGVELSEYPYDSGDEIEDYLEICHYAKVNAVIVAVREPSVLEDSESLIGRMRREGIVIASVDVDIGGDWSDVYIGVDNYELGRHMVQQAAPLFGQVERIAIVITEDTSTVNLRRLEGCMDQLDEYGLSDVTDELILSGEYIEQLFALREYSAELDAPTLLIIINPMRTIELANIISRNNMTNSVSIIGLGETEEALNYVGDGTVHALIMQDNYDMGAAAIRSLCEILDAPNSVVRAVSVDTVAVTEKNWEDVLSEIRKLR